MIGVPFGISEYSSSKTSRLRLLWVLMVAGFGLDIFPVGIAIICLVTTHELDGNHKSGQADVCLVSSVIIGFFCVFMIPKLYQCFSGVATRTASMVGGFILTWVFLYQGSYSDRDYSMALFYLSLASMFLCYIALPLSNTTTFKLRQNFLQPPAHHSSKAIRTFVSLSGVIGVMEVT